jgi:hypothetical protein
MKKSTIGAMLTAVNREKVTPSYAGEVDGNLKFGEKEYSLYTRLAGSQTGSLSDRKNGYEALAYFYKFSGTFGGQFFLDARSKDFEVNDLGFMGRANLIQSGMHLMADVKKPWALARKSGFNFNAWSSWNYDSANLAKGINLNTWNQLKNYWGFEFGISREFEALDDMETRGGPLMVKPAHLWGWIGFGTDERKLVSLQSHAFWKRTDDGLSNELGPGVGIDIRLASNVQFNIGTGYRIENKFAQWVKNVDDNGDGKDDHYVFGELKSRVLDLTTRLNVYFTTNTSLQLYLQPFVAVGNYSSFKELARPSSYDFIPYKLDENPDFISRSLRGNVVFRWEYKPGSVLFLVWSQSRSASPEIDDPILRPYEDLKDSFTDKGENVFLAKLSYWLGI